MPDERMTLSHVRMEHAEECLQAAKALAAEKSYKSSANRAYYCVFHAMRAVLALDGVDMKHHSGIISEFRRRYIKTGCFDRRLSEIISVLYDIRTDSDYDDFYVLSLADALSGIEDAEFFLTAIKQYLQTVSE